MTTTEEKVQGAIHGTEDTAKAVLNEAKGQAHKVGKEVEREATEVASAARQKLESIGHQVKHTVKNATPHKK
jgi:vacuolar-type H+-ATPase subunit H